MLAISTVFGCWFGFHASVSASEAVSSFFFQCSARSILMFQILTKICPALPVLNAGPEFRPYCAEIRILTIKMTLVNITPSTMEQVKTNVSSSTLSFQNLFGFCLAEPQ